MEEEEFPDGIEKILKQRIKNENIQYLVKWQGQEKLVWEYEEDIIDDFAVDIKNFQEAQKKIKESEKKEKQSKSKGVRSSHSTLHSQQKLPRWLREDGKLMSVKQIKTNEKILDSKLISKDMVFCMIHLIKQLHENCEYETKEVEPTISQDSDFFSMYGSEQIFDQKSRVNSLAHLCSKVIAFNMVDLKTGEYNEKLQQYVPLLPISLKELLWDPNLTSINFLGSNFLSDELMSKLSTSCPSLTSLNIKGYEWILWKCTNLKNLNISRTSICFDWETKFKYLPQIQTLNFSYNKFTKFSIYKLLHTRSDLIELIADNSILVETSGSYDFFQPAICTNLTSLLLNSVPEIEFREIFNFTSFPKMKQIFSVKRCPFVTSDKIPMRIAESCPNLNMFFGAGCCGAFEKIGTCTNLTYLDISLICFAKLHSSELLYFPQCRSPVHTLNVSASPFYLPSIIAAIHNPYFKLKNLQLDCRGITTKEEEFITRFYSEQELTLKPLSVIKIELVGDIFCRVLMNYLAKYLPIVEEIDIEVSRESFHQIAKYCTKIKTLKIRKAQQNLDDLTSWTLLAKNCTDLKDLKLYRILFRHEIVDQLMKLPKLVSLDVRCCTLNINFVRMLAEKPGLEMLEICSSCTNSEDEELVSQTGCRIVDTNCMGWSLFD